MTTNEADFRVWALQLVQAQVWPIAVLAQILDEKGVVSIGEMRDRFEGTIDAMKNMQIPGADNQMRPDVVLMQALVDALKGMELQKRSLQPGAVYDGARSAVCGQASAPGGSVLT